MSLLRSTGFSLVLLFGYSALAFGQSYGSYPAYGETQYGSGLASQRGFQDGVNDGRNDRQRGKNSNPTKTEHYEDTPGYDSSYGDRSAYKQIYRQSYIAGYQRAFGENSAYGQYGNENDAYQRENSDQYGHPRYGYNAGYQRGLQDGLNDGRNDRQRGRSFNPTKTDHYEDTPGYDSSFGSKDEYREVYRQAYRSGYQQAFGQGDAFGRPDGYDQSQYGYNPASERGFQDGVNDGRNARERGHSFNPTKTEHYEDTPGYDSAFGDKNHYKQIYRQAYTSGYQRGFGQGDRKNYDGYPQ